ncbi:hypothetical protein KLEPA_00266 (plasmid) [Klebsiella pneumoniae]
MIPSSMWQPKPGMIPPQMYIQHLAEQADGPATIVVTDKGIPQSDSFVKYAV